MYSLFIGGRSGLIRLENQYGTNIMMLYYSFSQIGPQLIMGLLNLTLSNLSVNSVLLPNYQRLYIWVIVDQGLESPATAMLADAVAHRARTRRMTKFNRLSSLKQYMREELQATPRSGPHRAELVHPLRPICLGIGLLGPLGSSFFWPSSIFFVRQWMLASGTASATSSMRFLSVAMVTR